MRYVGSRIFQMVDTNWDPEPGLGCKVAEPSRLCLFSLQQRCSCGETPQPPWWFMGSRLFLFELLTGHEPGRDSPRRHRVSGTEVQTVCLVSPCLGASVVQTGFMGREDLQILDTYWDHEPGRPKGFTIPSPGRRPRNGMSIVASALKGRADRLAEWLGPFRAECGFWGGVSQGVAGAGFWGRPSAFGRG